MKVQNKKGTFLVSKNPSSMGFGSQGTRVYQVLMTKHLKNGKLYKTKALIGFTGLSGVAKIDDSIESLSKYAFKVGDILNKKLKVISI